MYVPSEWPWYHYGERICELMRSAMCAWEDSMCCAAGLAARQENGAVFERMHAAAQARWSHSMCSTATTPTASPAPRRALLFSAHAHPLLLHAVSMDGAVGGCKRILGAGQYACDF